MIVIMVMMMMLLIHFDVLVFLLFPLDMPQQVKACSSDRDG
jgi:NADH:ubiquinone oxidoreductase subunit 3 (subunit A)